jgi:hypothetical protein
MSSGQTRQHDPGQISLVLGTALATGFAKGSFVEMDRYEDGVKMDCGSDGEVTIIISQNKTGYVKATFQQSSPMHDFLTAKAQAMEQRNLKVAVFPFTLKDNNGTTLGQAVQGWVKKKPKVTYSDGMENWEWTIDTGYLDNQPGGQNVI